MPTFRFRGLKIARNEAKSPQNRAKSLRASHISSPGDALGLPHQCFQYLETTGGGTVAVNTAIYWSIFREFASNTQYQDLESSVSIFLSCLTVYGSTARGRVASWNASEKKLRG